MAELHPLHHAGDDLVHAVLELFILPLALGIADLLEDHLLGGLGSNAAELDRRQRIDDEVADRGVGLLLLRVLEADRKRKRLNSSHKCASSMPSFASKQKQQTYYYSTRIYN